MTQSKPTVAAELRKPGDVVKEIARVTTHREADVGRSVALHPMPKNNHRLWQKCRRRPERPVSIAFFYRVFLQGGVVRPAVYAAFI
jgi:hypothetical protein